MSGLIVKNNSGLTGTPFVHLIEHPTDKKLDERYIETIKYDTKSNNNMLLAYMNVKSTFENNNFVMEKIDLDVIIEHCINNNYSCLIDAGAEFLQFSNSEIAEKIAVKVAN
jgi:hypothetical protein